jgi:hypothetical protein
MKYKADENLEGLKRRHAFTAWQPSSWPEPNPDIKEFIKDLMVIFEDSLLNEIENVISDAEKVNGDIQHRGHVIALALFCAVDALSSYAFDLEEGEVCPTCGKGKERVGPRYKKYIVEFFPDDYKSHAADLYKVYRNSLVHSWNLFEVAMTPDHDRIQKAGNTIQLGLLNFHEALETSVKNFIERLKNDTDIQKQAYARYNSLRSQAVS